MKETFVLFLFIILSCNKACAMRESPNDDFFVKEFKTAKREDIWFVNEKLDEINIDYWAKYKSLCERFCTQYRGVIWFMAYSAMQFKNTNDWGEFKDVFEKE